MFQIERVGESLFSPQEGRTQEKERKARLSLRRTCLFELHAHSDGDTWTNLWYAGVQDKSGAAARLTCLPQTRATKTRAQRRQLHFQPISLGDYTVLVVPKALQSPQQAHGNSGSAHPTPTLLDPTDLTHTTALFSLGLYYRGMSHGRH